MCKTTNGGARPRPLLRHVQVNVPLVPPTDEEKKAALSAVQWTTLPQHLLYSLPQFVQVPLTPTGPVPPAVAAVPPPLPPPVSMQPMALAMSMKPELPPTMAALPSAAPKQRLVRPACINCRRSKVRCEGGIPCRRCIRLSIDNSCERCEAKKRGRKRKPEMDAMRDMMLSGSSSSQQQQLMMSGDQSGMTMDGFGAGYPNKRLKPSLLPPRLQEDASRDSIEQFAAFTAQFRSWREKLTADPNADQTALSRFLFFCSYLSHMVKDYIDAHQSTANQQQMLSDWLCSNLAEDVHKFVENVGTDIVSFPDLCALAGETSPADVLQVNVEKQVFKQLPMGVVMLPLHPYPFHADAKAFVNDKMPLLLGYTNQQLKALLSDRDCFPRLLHSSSSSKFMSQFWDAIADGATHYSGTAAWVHQSGEVVELNGTFAIKYKHGLPVRWTMFLQAGPQDIERLQRASQLSLQMAEQLTSDSDELPSTPSGDLAQDQAAPGAGAASSSAVSSSAVLPPSAAAALASSVHHGAAAVAAAPDLSMMLPDDAKSANMDSFSSPSTIKDLSTPSSPSAASSVCGSGAQGVPSAAAGVGGVGAAAQFDYPMAFTPYKNSFAVAPTLPEKAHPWNAVSADSSVLEMLMAQQPELQFS